jgi:sulfoxide reductase heme-binding subunit YedZ
MIAAAGPSALWYLTRGTGLVTLVLLTASLVLGVLQVQRWGSPRFVVVSLHRAISLLVVVFVAVHVVTAVLDGYAPIRLVDAVLPFAGSYRPIWLGLGAVAFDLIVALTVTSLLRRHLGLAAWRTVHWLAYACWPIALVHGWGTGSDTRTPWMLATTLTCATAVIAAIAWRLASGWSENARARGTALGATVLVGAVVGAWLAIGPLADGWARRAGTPASLLRPAAAAGSPLERSFSATVRGTLRQRTSADGSAVVDLRMRLIGGPQGVLRVRIAGPETRGGGVTMQRSSVTLGPPTAPGLLKGEIDTLQGTSFEALLRSARGTAVRVHADVTLSGDTVGGTVSGGPLAEATG